jgi:uncharacterized membrane protein
METVLLAHEGGGWRGGFLLLFLGLIATFLVLKFLVFRGGWQRSWPDTTPDAILKRRLASGEISEADYDRLSALLRR